MDEFLLHILPSRFVKIRHYGLLANRGRDSRVELARQLIGPPPPETPANDGDKQRPARVQLTCTHCG